jgi:hypothetical protein
MLCKEPDTINWRKERDCFIKCWTKLVSSSDDLVANSNITYNDLCNGVAESISSG